LVSSQGYRRYAGQESEQLVSALAQRQQASEVLLTSSGTAAVELVLRAAGVGKGDEVILSAYDYPGNFWAIERIGARPVLVDTEPMSWRIDHNQLDVALRSSGAGKCKALIVSHLHGQLQDMVSLRAWCDDRGPLLIEDACQALGGEIADRPAGSFGHAGILSFGGGKLLSAGRGGAVLTSDPMLAQKARIAAGAGSGPFTMSELQSAVVLAQLAWLDELVGACRNYFGALADRLRHSGALRLPFADDSAHTSYYQAGILWNAKSTLEEASSQELTPPPLTAFIDQLRAKGIPAGSGFPGFQRRSVRRCRQAAPLHHTAHVAANTCTIHYSAAFATGLSSAQLAQILVRLSNN
jgi:dTDP-4-amino-4,6-dideoxygalactose transaminase